MPGFIDELDPIIEPFTLDDEANRTLTIGQISNSAEWVTSDVSTGLMLVMKTGTVGGGQPIPVLRNPTAAELEVNPSAFPQPIVRSFIELQSMDIFGQEIMTTDPETRQRAIELREKLGDFRQVPSTRKTGR